MRSSSNSARHSELLEEDVLVAWEGSQDMTLRMDGLSFPEYVCTGHDARGRHIEMVGVMTKDGWLIYHAQTSPTKKTLKEIDRAQRRRT